MTEPRFKKEDHPALTGKERRERRLAAEAKAERELHPDVGQTDEEFRGVPEDEYPTTLPMPNLNKGKVSVDKARVQERLALWKAGRVPITDEEVAAFYEIATNVLRKEVLDSRDKSLITQMFKFFADTVGAAGAKTGDEIARTFDQICAEVQAVAECEKRGGDPTEMYRLETVSKEHVARLLKREIKGLDGAAPATS